MTVYKITILVEDAQTGDMIEKLTLETMDYQRHWTDSPPRLPAGMELIAPLNQPFRLEIPRVYRRTVETP